MLNNIGIPGLILILGIALVIFGPSKLPQLGKALGATLREFRSSTKGVVDEIAEDGTTSQAKPELEHNKKA